MRCPFVDVQELLEAQTELAKLSHKVRRECVCSKLRDKVWSVIIGFPLQR